MATFTLHYTNDSSLDATFTIPDAAIDAIHTSLTLYGHGGITYGENVDQDLIRLLQHFAYSSAPPHPLLGQTWFDTTTQKLKVYTSDLGGPPTLSWITLASINPPTGSDGSISVVGGTIYIWANGGYQQIYPLLLPNIGNTGTGAFNKVDINSQGLTIGTTPVTAADVAGLPGIAAALAGAGLIGPTGPQGPTGPGGVGSVGPTGPTGPAGGGGGPSPGTAKAWGSITGSGFSTTIFDSFNVSSVTGDGSGSFYITFTSIMANANYAFVNSVFPIGSIEMILKTASTYGFIIYQVFTTTFVDNGGNFVTASEFRNVTGGLTVDFAVFGS